LTSQPVGASAASTAQAHPPQTVETTDAPERPLKHENPTIIIQKSKGANSPNIVGDNVQVNINPGRTSRRLTKDQMDIMVSILKEFPGLEVEIETILGDREANDFALDFVAVFRAAQWNLGGPRGYSSSIYAPVNPAGLQIRFRSNNDSTPSIPPIANALKAAGIEPQAILKPDMRPDQVKIVIGVNE
jgi:hypothetical protein